jgi:hypothetical protein
VLRWSQPRSETSFLYNNMLEPFFGLMACLAIYAGVWLASKVSSEFTRDSSFEKWCQSQPMIMAFRCRGEASETRFKLRQWIAPHSEVVNLHGGAPWQYYRFDVVVREHSDSVVAVHIAEAIPQRGNWTERTDAADLVNRIVRSAAVEEVWLHGQLHPSEARSTSRDQRGWLGRVAEDGALEVTPMIGKPAWVGDAGEELAGVR